MRRVVAIDGPGGSGKSTVARMLARRLGVPHVDTGAWYRLAALVVLRAGVDPDDEPAVLTALGDADLSREGGRALLNGLDVSQEIRGPRVTGEVSRVARHPQVRELLVERQRAEATDAGAVVEGRDAGTVVVPDAPLKVWLTAEVSERARRRAAERRHTDQESIATEAADLDRRDAADARQMARAVDAVAVDTTGRSVEDVVDELVNRLARLVRA